MRSSLIGRRIREIRAATGMSGWELAGKVGMTPAQVSRLEQGLRGFRGETLDAFSEALGVPPLYFFVEDDEAFTAQLSRELEAKGLKLTRRLKKQLTNPGFLQFLERRAEEFNADPASLERIERAARRATIFPVE